MNGSSNSNKINNFLKSIQFQLCPGTRSNESQSDVQPKKN